MSGKLPRRRDCFQHAAQRADGIEVGIRTVTVNATVSGGRLTGEKKFVDYGHASIGGLKVITDQAAQGPSP